jgi:hypothetical protein
MQGEDRGTVILREAIEAHPRHVFKITGDDAFCAAIHTANDALPKALDAQCRLQHVAWNPTPKRKRRRG